jgi:hypothetical protein
MKRVLTAIAACSVLLLLVVPAASATPAGDGHPGCTGIEQALGKASAKGKSALTVVADKLGCGAVDPDPVDTVACPAGEVSLARWTYTGVLSDDVDEYGYHWWIGAWTNTNGTGAAIPHGDAGGFYWTEVVPDSVRSIVIQSFTGEVQVVTDVPPAGDPTWVLDPSRAVSQNWFADRTGINLVNFCGAGA